MEKGFKNLQTAARGARRGSNRHESPYSHISDPGFDDSGLGADLSGSRQHTPATHVLPPLHQQAQVQTQGQAQARRDSPSSRASPAARSTHAQSYGPPSYANAAYANNTNPYPPSAPTLEARPPVLSSTTTSYAYPQYVASGVSASSAAYAGLSYPSAAAAATGTGTGGPSWSAPSMSVGASASQRLPSLSENLTFLPPPMPFAGVPMGARGHIATSTYG